MIETAITAIYDEMPLKYKYKIKRIWILLATCLSLFLLGLVFVLKVHNLKTYKNFDTRKNKCCSERGLYIVFG